MKGFMSLHPGLRLLKNPGRGNNSKPWGVLAIED